MCDCGFNAFTMASYLLRILLRGTAPYEGETAEYLTTHMVVMEHNSRIAVHTLAARSPFLCATHCLHAMAACLKWA